MQIRTSNNTHKKKNIIARTVIVILLCLVMLPALSSTADADVATDTLTIKVGYLGMELKEYVKVDSYNWRELAKSMSLHKVAYSYFQKSSKTKYTAIVDSAQGFYVSDLLNFASIHYGDVKNLKFYVEDHKGIRTSFDSGALFRSRYYYEDLAGNRTIHYGTKTVTKQVTETIHHDAVYEKDEDGNDVLVKEAYDEEVTREVTEEVPDKSKIVEYTFENAKRHAKSVQPMLAIEDNWAQFNEEFEHIGSDFSSMNSATRFRLLFGQTSPTESMTGQSDKYVSCVYVTLNGAPTIGEMGGLSGKYGSHKVSMTVGADNVNVRNALSSLMNIKSTNTDVLVITGVQVTPDSKYSDLAQVTVSYKIVGEGEASITAGVGAESDPIMTSESVVGEADPNSSKENSEGGKGSGGTNNNNKKSEDTSGKEELKQQRKASTEVSRAGSTFRLSEQAARELNSAIQPQADTAALEEVTEVKQEDNTKEKEKEQKKLILLTVVGCLILVIGGGAAEAMSFSLRLHGNKFRHKL